MEVDGKNAGHGQEEAGVFPESECQRLPAPEPALAGAKELSVWERRWPLCELAPGRNRPAPGFSHDQSYTDSRSAMPQRETSSAR